MMNDKETKPMMASASRDTSHGTLVAATSTRPGIESTMKQETPASDINVKEETYVVEVLNDDGDSSNEFLNEISSNEFLNEIQKGRAELVSFLRHMHKGVGYAHCGAVSVKSKEYTAMENKMKCEEDAAPALKKIMCKEAALVKQEMESGDDGLVKEERKYHKDVVVEKEIKSEEGAAAKE